MKNKNNRQRELVNRTRVSTSIDTKLLERLEEIHKATKIPKSKLYDKALEMLSKKYSEYLENKLLTFFI